MTGSEDITTPRPETRELGCLALLAGLGFAGACLLAKATPGGPAVAPDSVDYVIASRSLLAGQGLMVHAGPDGLAPMTHFPPLFPGVLAVIGLAGVDALDAARWLNVALFGFNVALIGFLLWILNPSARWTPVFGSLLLLATPTVLEHALALSEPLFLALGFSGLALLARGIEKPSRGYVAAAGLAIGLAFLCRWAGVAFVAAGAAGVIACGPRTLRLRLATAAAFTILAASPGLGWMLRNQWLAASASGRSLAWHPIGALHIEQLADTLEQWGLLPPAYGLGVLALLCLFAVAATRLGRQRAPAPPRGSTALAPLLGLFLVAYSGMLVLSISLVDHQTPLNSRILVPVLLPAMVLLIHAVHRAVAILDRRPVAWAAAAAGAVFIAAHAMATGPWLARSMRDGQPFFGKLGWSESDVVERVRQLPERVHIYSNGADALYLLTNRRASDLPRKANPASRTANARYGPEMREVLKRMRSGDAVIVWLDRMHWRWYFPTKKELLIHHPLRAAVLADDGVIFVAKR